MKHKNDFEERILDDLLVDSMEDLYPDVEDFSGNDYEEPSKEFQDSMKKMFQQERKKLKRKMFYRRLPKIVAIFILLIVGAFITANTTSAWKEPLYNFFFHTSDDQDKTKVEITEDDAADMERYLPKYVPEGFESVDNTYSLQSNQYYIHYEHDKLYITIIIVLNKADLYLDLSSFNKFEYNHIIYYTNNENKLIWNYKNYYFLLSSNLNQSEMLKIANSIK